MSKTLVLMCILAVAMCPVANATQVVSSDFSIGLGFNSWERAFTESETAIKNTLRTQGDFTFSPVVTSNTGTGGGWYFPDRVPTSNGANGYAGYDDGSANPWVLTLNASYNGVAQTGGKITVNITSISIYGADYRTEPEYTMNGAATMWFTETTAGNVGNGPVVNAKPFTGDTDPSCWAHLVWNPGALQVDGETAVRSFGIDEANTKWGGVLLDGFEITGNITYESVPEPATMLLLCAGGLLFRKK